MLKINLFQTIVENSRSKSIDLQYIQSSLFDATSCQTDEDAEFIVLNNITDIPEI